MFFLLNKKEPKNQGKFKSPAMVVCRTIRRYPGHDHLTHHRTSIRPTKFSFAIALYFIKDVKKEHWQWQNGEVRAG